jgi:hypothetical protein
MEELDDDVWRRLATVAAAAGAAGTDAAGGAGADPDQVT